jgi:CelD/BcsL family acetyltransferase involved in cellulose biosynthesis
MSSFVLSSCQQRRRNFRSCCSSFAEITSVYTANKDSDDADDIVFARFIWRRTQHCRKEGSPDFFIIFDFLNDLT